MSTEVLVRGKNVRQVCVLLLLVAFSFHVFASAGAASNQRQLGVKLTEVGQENCRGPSPSEGPVVRLKLQLEVINLTDTKLIVSKAIGAAFYGIILADDERSISDGAHEEIHTEWIIKESPLPSPPFEVPPAEFAFLDPGESFIVKRTVYLPTHPLLRAAEKVLQLNLATWFHTPAPQAFRDGWKNYGELVYVSTKSDFVSFHIPLEADFTECKP
jgi:hypothetical protein